MKKRLLCLVLSLLMLLPVHAFAAGGDQEFWSREESNGDYVTVRIPCPEGEGMLWNEQHNLIVCYADTGEPVALCSDYKQGYLFATVPAKDAHRTLKVVQGEHEQFEDCIKVWREEQYYEPPLGADQLNIRGIILGDGTGNLNPDQVITRAEAFTILCRLLSLSGKEDPGFSDVSSGDWYYETASAAKAAGLTVETEYFSPLREVTRGEITVMLYRAMQTIGWMQPVKADREVLTAVDDETVPDWALDAYTAFGQWNLGMFTYRNTEKTDEFGAPVQETLLMQNAGATRGEVIKFIYNALRFLPVYPTELAIRWGFDEEMPVIDGSTSTLPYSNAVYAALFHNWTKHTLFPAKHSKSYYSYERLINGEADILFISTKPTEDTLAKAKAAGVELELIPIAHDAMVFFTNGENSIDNLTMEQIRNIYVHNTYANWLELGGPSADLIPYCRNADSGSQAQMEEFFLKGNDIHPDIRRETTAISMASVLTDVWEAKNDNPLAYALGYSIYYYYRNASMILLSSQDDLKLLKIEGVYPTDETIADGSYPLAGYNYAVVRADSPEGSIARRMVEFMVSEAGQNCVVNAGFGALN